MAAGPGCCPMFAPRPHCWAHRASTSAVKKRSHTAYCPTHLSQKESFENTYHIFYPCTTCPPSQGSHPPGPLAPHGRLARVMPYVRPSDTLLGSTCINLCRQDRITTITHCPTHLPQREFFEYLYTVLPGTTGPPGQTKGPQAPPQQAVAPRPKPGSTVRQAKTHTTYAANKRLWPAYMPSPGLHVPPGTRVAKNHLKYS